MIFMLVTDLYWIWAQQSYAIICCEN